MAMVTIVVMAVVINDYGFDGDCFDCDDFCDFYVFITMISLIWMIFKYHVLEIDDSCLSDRQLHII